MDQRHSRPTLLCAGAAMLLTASLQAAPASATQVDSGRLEANAAGAGVFTRPDTVQWKGPAEFKKDLEAHAIYNSPPVDTPGANAESHAFLSAHWESFDRGVVDFANDGITVNQGARIDDGILAIYSASWEYRFIADADGVLNFDLNAAFTGVQDDIGFWRVGAVDVLDQTKGVVLTADGYAFGHNSLELTGSLRLTAGHLYQFALGNSGDSRNFEIPGPLQGNEVGRLTWSITSDAEPVPEPASWALLMVGFGAAGSLLRTRRRRLSAV